MVHSLRILTLENAKGDNEKMEDLMDYPSLSLFPNVRLPPKFKMLTLDKFDGTGSPKSYLKMYMRAMQVWSLIWQEEEQGSWETRRTRLVDIKKNKSDWETRKTRLDRSGPRYNKHSREILELGSYYNLEPGSLTPYTEEKDDIDARLATLDQN